MNASEQARADCPICRQVRASRRPLDAIVDLPTSWVTTGYPEPPVPGYACVVHRRHVVEPYELDDEEGAAYWQDVMRTARALAEATNPRKLNYEIHGNTIEHLHTHLLPREPAGNTDSQSLAASLRHAFE
jgi:diadenosine tetraphosphate (Ap4A) HIT family hydrolase